MQSAIPFQTVPRRKVRLYRRKHLRAIHEMLEKERQEKRKRAKLAAKKYEHDWRVSLLRLQSKEESCDT